MSTEELRVWLSERFPSYAVDEPMQGTYGLVWILRSKADNHHPQRFALKTVDPKALERKGTALELREAFERELRLWLKIPNHFNVLPATCLDLAHVSHPFGAEWGMLPVVSMPFCDGTLREWVADSAIPIADKLIAIAQVCEGLRWIYEHGIEGHGDLKPENLLRIDYSRKAHLPAGAFPGPEHPWQIRVADLGWANAWIDAGQTHRAWRPYLAPERAAHTFVPQASDVFAVGVIACELVTGLHPAGMSADDVSKKWSQKKWLEWTAHGPRHVDAVKDSRLRETIERCVGADPAGRPTLGELAEAVGEVVRRDHGVDVLAALKGLTDHFRRMPANSEAIVAAWHSRGLSALSDTARERQIAEAEARLRRLPLPTAPVEALDWLETAKALCGLLLARRHPGDLEGASKIAEDTGRFVLAHFDDIDLVSARGLRPKEDEDDLMGFESWEFMHDYATNAIAALAEVVGEQSPVVQELHAALSAKWRSKQPTVEQFLARPRGGLK